MDVVGGGPGEWDFDVLIYTRTRDAFADFLIMMKALKSIREGYERYSSSIHPTCLRLAFAFEYISMNVFVGQKK